MTEPDEATSFGIAAASDGPTRCPAAGSPGLDGAPEITIQPARSFFGSENGPR
jgi:hypothetical protein